MYKQDPLTKSLTKNIKEPGKCYSLLSIYLKKKCLTEFVKSWLVKTYHEDLFISNHDSDGLLPVSYSIKGNGKFHQLYCSS